MEKSELGHRPGGKRLPTLGYRVGAPAGGTSNGKAIVGRELQLHIPACGLRNGIRENQEAEGKEPQCSHRSRATSEMGNYTRSAVCAAGTVDCLSRQSEKFLIGQSRKFLLTAKNWKGRTNRDEPGGTRLAGVVEAGENRRVHAGASRREDGRQRPLGAKAAGAHENRWRRGCRARTAGPVVEPADRRTDAGACRRVAEAAGVARLRADVRQRAVGQAARHRRQQGDGARMDGVGRAMEGAVAQTRRGAFLAAATERLRRVGAVGHVESRLAGGARRSRALPGEVDRRCHQPRWSQRPLKTGTFYFARKRNFLLCLDTRANWDPANWVSRQ